MDKVCVIVNILLYSSQSFKDIYIYRRVSHQWYDAVCNYSPDLWRYIMSLVKLNHQTIIEIVKIVESHDMMLFHCLVGYKISYSLQGYLVEAIRFSHLRAIEFLLDQRTDEDLTHIIPIAQCEDLPESVLKRFLI
jgi:predicted choloylglycine hydrolase